MFHSVAAGTAGPGTETLPASDIDSTAIIKRGRKKHAHTHTSLSYLSCCCLSTPVRRTHRAIYSNEFVLKYLAARPPGCCFKAT